MKKIVIFGIFISALTPNMTSLLSLTKSPTYPLQIAFWDKYNENLTNKTLQAPSTSAIDAALQKIDKKDSIKAINFIQDLVQNCQLALEKMNSQAFVKSETDNLHSTHQKTANQIQEQINKIESDCEISKQIATHLKANGALTEHLLEAPTLTTEQEEATASLINAVQNLDFQGVQSAVEAGANVNPGFIGSPPFLVSLQRKEKSCPQSIENLQKSLISEEVIHAEKTKTMSETIEKLREKQSNYCKQLSDVLSHVKNYYKRY